MPIRDTHSLRWVAAVIGPLLVVAWLLLMPVDAVGASPPTIAITSPTAGATVKGTVHIEATATASSGDYPTSISFYDGVNRIGSVNCQDQQTCIASVEWHATGLSGQHELTAYVETNEKQSATSAVVMVTVVSPPPSIKITSPAPGATVKGTVIISAEVATDPSQEDYPTEISFYDGVNGIGHVHCQGQQTCQGQVEWHATGLTGTHTLTARASTNRNLSVTSAQVPVTAISPPPTVKITHPGDGAPLRGTVSVGVYGETDPSQVDYPTSIDVYDGTSEIGYVSCQGQRTCAGTVQWNTTGLRGTQVLRATIHTNANREATSSPVYVGGYLSRPHARANCHIALLHVRVRRGDRVSCFASVPVGTAVAIQYRTTSDGWANLFHEHVPAGGHFFFTVRGRRRSIIRLSVFIAQTNHFSATRVSLGTLHIV
jgi:hypothetical protein